jgi:hypothetical protein
MINIDQKFLRDKVRELEENLVYAIKLKVSKKTNQIGESVWELATIQMTKKGK